ncbi:unnamed protein product [Nyctereutes procyonoides]|uniref:(raccoon dog) hypothetical protein n=1 Tax=Nyctereutes procyonoides TaxID=34880 RepID=A0A811YRI5_NYCPR|nr:unnamed protein product [Nyctereutes procyonoides]
MRFEELLDQVDGFGPFQVWNVALMALPRVLLPMHFLLPIFLAAVPAHHCALPGAPVNFSHQDAWPTCPRSLMAPSAPASASPTPRPSPTPCLGEWVRALGSWRAPLCLFLQWDLVCEQKDLNRATSTFFFLLVCWWGPWPLDTCLMGGVQWGFGQHCLLLVAYVSSLVLGLASTALVSYIMFVITCSVTGMALAGFTIIVMLLEMEWLDVGHRTEAGVLDSIFWTRDVMRDAVGTGQVPDTGLRDVAVGLCLTGLLLSPRWVPESAHWLLTQGHVEEAHRYLLHCSRLNGWPMGEDSLSQERVVQRLLYLDLFRTPRLHHISLCCIVMWFGVNFFYYGLSLDVSRLGLDVYQMQLLFGAVEVPSKLLVDLLVRHVGHCLVQAGMLQGTALALGSSLLMWAWCTTLVVIWKSFSEAAFTTAYLFTSELYPTVLRDGADCTGMPAVGLFGPIGGLSRWEYGCHCPSSLMGGLPCWLACTALLLPETKQVQLPETIQDVERSALSSLQKEEMPMKQVQD